MTTPENGVNPRTCASLLNPGHAALAMREKLHCCIIGLGPRANPGYYDRRYRFAQSLQDQRFLEIGRSKRAVLTNLAALLQPVKPQVVFPRIDLSE